MGKQGLGTGLMTAAALFYGAMNISVKLSAPYLTLWQTAMGRFALGLVLIPLLAWRLKMDLFGRDRWLLFARGVSATGAFLLLIQAFKTIPLSEGMVLFYLWPVFACLLSARVAGEPTGKREWPFVAGALAGTVLILWPGGGADIDLRTGHFFALGASFFAGLAVILIRRLRRTNNAFTIYFYFCITGGLVCLVPLIAQNAPVLPASGRGWMVLGAVAVFAMAGQVIMNQGMKYVSGSRTGVLMMIEVIAASCFGIVFLKEPLGLRLVLGALLILGCGFGLIFLPQRDGGRVPESRDVMDGGG
jgi:drug/metabolite transporter (DMT)-like permease